MRIGFNFTLGETLPLFQQLVAERHIDFVEVLIDNFFHVEPKQLAGAFDCPIGFHIMFSKFMESDKEFLESMARKIRAFMDEVNPLYVSDHMARFSHEGRTLFHLAEVDYAGEYNSVREHVEWWQEKLGMRLYLENFPSIMDGGRGGPEFFARLTRETGCGVLFDISNAVVAQQNCGLSLDAWQEIMAATPHFHVAGYHHSFIEPHVTIDTHDQELSPETLAFLESGRSLFEKPGATMTYERDGNIEYDSIVADLDRLRQVFLKPEEEHHASAVGR